MVYLDEKHLMLIGYENNLWFSKDAGQSYTFVEVHLVALKCCVSSE